MNDNQPSIPSKNYEIRGLNVMLDRDLAELYGVKAIRLREQVKRNATRFPSTFMFQLNPQEVDFMVSQNAIPSKSALGGSMPYAFTEHGILMLANVIKSNIAIDMSIKIIEVFVKVRQMMLSHQELTQKLKALEAKYDQQFTDVYEALNFLIQKSEEPKPADRKSVGFKT